MLTEQRFERILERLKVKKSITVAEITEDLGISESTARRDITALDKAGKLTKCLAERLLPSILMR